MKSHLISTSPEHFLIKNVFYHFFGSAKNYEKWPISIRFFACDLENGPPDLSMLWLFQYDSAMHQPLICAVTYRAVSRVGHG